MVLGNPRYDAIMREYGRQQVENHHELEGRRQEIYTRLSVVRQLEAEIVERSVTYVKKLLEGDKSVLDRLKKDLKDPWEQRSLIIGTVGYPNDYLKLHYRCPDCRDTGLIDGRKCHCFLQAQMKLFHAQSNLEDVLEWENFNALNCEYYDDTGILSQLGITNAVHICRVVAGCRELVRDFDEKHDNLLFTGSTGVGKIFLTNCIAKESIDDSHSAIYLIASNLFDVSSRNKFDYDNAEDMKDMYRFILDCGLLIIDDLGAELNSSFTSPQLSYCISERTNISRSIIISTNLILARFRDSYIDRAISRTTNGYRIIPLYGGDVRLLKK